MKNLFLLTALGLFLFGLATMDSSAQFRGKGKATNPGQGLRVNFVDANGDGICDKFVDANGDGICDHCVATGAGMGQGARGRNFVDANGDGICDNFVDANGDGLCDHCTGTPTKDGTGKKYRGGRGL